VPKFDTASVRDSVFSSFAAMPYLCWLAGTEVNAAIWTAFSQNDLKAAKSLVLLVPLPWTTEDPCLIFFGDEARAIEYANADVYGVLVGD
jgi:hypothetical protein